jgi:hypothetical protein
MVLGSVDSGQCWGWGGKAKGAHLPRETVGVGPISKGQQRLLLELPSLLTGFSAGIVQGNQAIPALC